MLFTGTSCKAFDVLEDKGFRVDGILYRNINETQVAVGSIEVHPESKAVFIPSRVEGYDVVQLGFDFPDFGLSGINKLYVNGNPDIQRVYFPGSIIGFTYDYTQFVRYTDIFYCGKVQNLYPLLASQSKIYVPNEEYEKFFKVTEDAEYFLLPANITYLLNYREENDYYYVDSGEYGEPIRYIPPRPEREGYSFEGWYTEAECIHE